MEKLINFVDKFKIIFFIVIAGCCLVRFAVGLQQDTPLKENLISLLVSTGSFFLVWGAVFFVLGFQHINPFCPKKVFRFFCYITFFFGLYATVCGIIDDTILPVLSKEPLSDFCTAPGGFGFVYGSICLFKKYGKDDSDKD